MMTAKSIARMMLGAFLAGAAAGPSGSHSQALPDGSPAWQIDTGG